MPSLASRAKINLFLEVTGKRRDGFHNLDSLFLEIDLADRLSMDPAPAGVFSLDCDDATVPTGDDNLVLRAARLLAKRCGLARGARFRLEKRIPMGGGLGGGSSNAAAALILADAAWRTALSRDRLAELGGEIGSDVPFFLRGGFCRIGGRGETVTPLPGFSGDIPLGVVLSAIHSGTAAAFAGLRIPAPDERRSPEPFLRALAAGDAGAMAETAFNRFEETVFAAIPELGEIHRRLEAVAGIPVRLSGTGASLWFFGDAMTVAARVRDDPVLARYAAERGLRVAGVRPFAGGGGPGGG